MLARQIAVKKVLTCTIIKGGAIAMYEPPVSSFANRAALVVVDRIGSVLAVKLRTRSVNFLKPNIPIGLDRSPEENQTHCEF